MSNGRFRLQGFSLLLACLSGLWLGSRSAPEPASSAPTEAGRSVAASSAQSAVDNEPTAFDRSASHTAKLGQASPPARRMRTQLPALAARASWLPLPAENLPVKAAFATLKARADRGDAAAACRLAGELLRCRQVQSPSWSLSADQEVVASSRQHCQGVAASEMQWLTELLRQAALAGNRAAIEEYVSGSAFEFEPRQAVAYLADYQAEVPMLSAAALRAGSVRMLYEFEVAYDYGASSTWLGRAMATERNPDLVLDLQLLKALVVGAGGRGEGTLEARRAEAKQNFEKLIGTRYAAREQLALQRLNDWFGGQPKRASLGGLALLGQSQWNPALNDVCSEDLIEQPLKAAPLDWLPPQDGSVPAAR